MKNFTKKFQRQVQKQQPRRLKICVAIPHTGTVRMETCMSVVAILASTPHDIFFAQREGAYVEQNRTRLIKMAKEQGCEKVFFLDSDIMVEGDVINKLLAHNKPIIGAAYNMRSFPLYSNVKFTDENGKFIAVPTIPAELFKCAGVPTGAMLVDIATVEKLPHPWFDLINDENGELLIGEDIYFCQKLIKHGIEIWCDPTISIKHIGTFPY